MIAFILRRLGLLLPTFIGVTLIAFALIHLIPGDPIELMAGERGIDPARHALLRAELGFDKPLWQQYFSYVFNIFQGDLGSSLVTRAPVLHEFFTLFPATIELSFSQWYSPYASVCRWAFSLRLNAARCSITP